MGEPAVTGYVIRYSSDNWITSKTWLNTPSLNTSATVSGLRNGIVYAFRIAAQNSRGVGVPASTTAAASDPAATRVVSFVTSSTYPVDLQFSYRIKDENGKLQPHTLYAHKGSLDKLTKISVPDFNNIEGPVTVTVTALNLPRGQQMIRSFSLPAKGAYSYRISVNYQVYDPRYGYGYTITCQ